MNDIKCFFGFWIFRKILKYKVCGCIILSIVLVSGIVGCARKKGPKPNIVLITIDTLRADALGCYGSPNAVTLVIDELAREGVLFENLMSQAPATGPSFASMMTSKYPSACGVLHNTMPLQESQTTLAEILKENGYSTAAFVSCTILKSEYGFSQGFDVFDDNMENHYSKNDKERSSPTTTQEALSWLKTHSGNPFFLWIHYFDPHAPYESHGDNSLDGEKGTLKFLVQLWRKQSREEIDKHLSEIKQLYAKEVGFLDNQIGKVLAQLKQMGIRDNTIIGFAADHGEELFDHRFFHGHYISLSQSVLHTPLILSYPPKLPKGLRVTGLVENTDIFPTLLALAKIEPPEDINGVNLLNALKNPSVLSERFRYAEREPYTTMPGGNGFTVRHKNFKYIHFSKALDMLFNLESDPGEKHSLTIGFEKEHRLLVNKLIQWREKNVSLHKSIEQQELNERDLKRLKSLGYVQ